MSQTMSPFAHARALMILGLPLVGGHLAQFLIGLTDTIMIGWYGVPELAALTLAGSLFMTLFLFGSGFAWAVMPMVAGASVRADDVTIRRVTRMAIWLSGLFFLCVMPLLWWSAPILRAIGQEASVALNAQTYLRIAGWGMAPALGVMVLKSYLAGLEHTRVVLWITVASAVANGLANYALIFGNWGAPELGIRGAAIASLASNLTALAGVMLYALRKLPQHQLFVRFWRPDREVFAQVFRLGWPIGITTLAEVALFAASAVMMGWIGTVPLAAHGIALQLATASFMIHLGLSNAATVRASNAAGRGDLDHLRRGAWVVSALSLAVVGLTTLVFLTLPDPLLGLFLDPDEPRRDAILEIGRVLLALAALFQLADAMQVIHVGVLRGLQDTKVPMVITTISYWAIGLTSSYLLAFTFDWGAVGLWLGLTFGLSCAAIGLGTRFWTSAPRLMPAAA